MHQNLLDPDIFSSLTHDLQKHVHQDSTHIRPPGLSTEPLAVPPTVLHATMIFLLLLQIALAVAALGVPTSRDRHAQRIARRAASPQMAHPVQGASRPAALASGNITESVYTSNWAGAVLVAGPVSPLLRYETVR